MKKLKIEVVLDGEKIASGMKTEGINIKSTEDTLLLIGVLENLKQNLLERLKTFMSMEKT